MTTPPTSSTPPAASISSTPSTLSTATPSSAALDIPELTGEEGWLDLRRDMWPDKGPSFVSGDRGDRLRVKYFRNQATGHLVGKVWFGPGTQGPPGHAHGGSMAALLDEVMGTAAWISGHPVLAASIKIDFRNTIPLQTVAFFEGWVDAVDGKKVTTRAKLLGPDGKVFAEGEGLFIRKENFFGKFAETNMKGMKALEKYAAKQQAEKESAAKAES